MRLIFVGPPGAGKGTQSGRICALFGIPHISSGEMFRAAIAEGSELGRLAEQHIRRGELVPDELTTQMVTCRLQQPDCSRGFLLDGFPRTLPQAAALDRALAESGVEIRAVLLLEVADELIVERITGRRQDPETGAIYHLKYTPPPPDVAPRLVQRNDDTEATCRARLRRYHADTASIVPYYESKGLLHRIDGVGAPAEVTDRIVQSLQTNARLGGTKAV